jgi:hypothetical protein
VHLRIRRMAPARVGTRLGEPRTGPCMEEVFEVCQDPFLYNCQDRLVRMRVEQDRRALQMTVISKDGS